MIVHFNYGLQTAHKRLDGSRESIADLTGRVAASLATLLQHGEVDARTLSTLRIHLDWIQYRANFRDPVIVRRAIDAEGRTLPLAEIAIDVRQVDADRLVSLLADAQKTLRGRPAGGGENRPLVLDEFRPLRDTIVWRFGRLYRERLADWEAAFGAGCDARPEEGTSDVDHPREVADSVGDFWTLLRDLEAHGRLPPEIYVLHVGVASAARARRWLDTFKALEEQYGSEYYSRLKVLLGVHSQGALDAAPSAMGPHGPIASVVPLDPMNPVRTLSFLRFKVLYVHLANVYTHLPFDELVRRDDRVYVVEARPYVSAATALHLAKEFGVAETELPALVQRVLLAGPDGFEDRGKGMAFWRCVWSALRLEERFRAIDHGEDGHVPAGLTLEHLDDLLEAAPHDIRFQISRGAAESLANTLPLLHPRGYLQAQDIFVSALDEYRQGFRGPGKLDGAVAAWVNGALLRAVAVRAGYDVHFAPFRYRADSKATILYTTQRD